VKVFISWSGDRSQAIAEELRDWLPTIVQSLEPFISTQDVPIGGRGLNVLASQLQDCSFGILCLTQENKQGKWIHFEAGALSKVIEASRVVPLLLDMKISDLTGPLVQFQAIAIEDRDGVFALVKALAEQSSPPIAESRIRRLFDAFWPELEEKVSQLKVAASEPKQDVRSEREILEEILLLSRNTERQMSRVITAQARGGAPSSRVIGLLTIRVIQDEWEEIVDAVKKNSRVAWMLLGSATPKNLTEDVLAVEFARDGDAKAFLRANHEKKLTDAILDVVGVRLRIVPVTQSGASPSTHPADDAELTGMELIQRELGGQVTSEPPSGYSDEPPF
jgi:hypothetical protein